MSSLSIVYEKSRFSLSGPGSLVLDHGSSGQFVRLDKRES